MATYQPTIRTGTVTFDQLVKQFYGAVDSAAASFSYYIQPNGGYSGHQDGTVTAQNGNIINPWGVAATAYISPNGYRGGGPEIPISLPASTSYSLGSGRYDDPNLSATTAQRLNDAINQRAVDQAGFSASQATTARSAPSVLATLDQMYLGSLRTTAAGTSSALAGIQQAGAVGFNEGSNKTILGASTDASKKPTTTTALKRALT